jgi:hypothetical protein
LAPDVIHGKRATMRNRRLQFEPIKIEVTREEILADLNYPAATGTEDRQVARRSRRRRTRRQGRRW